jgi:hypothetical protein
MACLIGYMDGHLRKGCTASKLNTRVAHTHAPGTYVTVHIAGVPADKAAALLQRVQGAQQQCQPPLVVFGLLQHESKMSVMNMGVSACLRLGYCITPAHAPQGSHLASASQLLSLHKHVLALS